MVAFGRSAALAREILQCSGEHLLLVALSVGLALLITVPLHLHTSAERMVLVAGELHVTYDGQKKEVLKTGTYAYGPARLPHSGFCASTVPCVLFIALESPLDAVPVDRSASSLPRRWAASAVTLA
jgi:uncharacterized RmlC-like cupin family protein